MEISDIRWCISDVRGTKGIDLEWISVDLLNVL